MSAVDGCADGTHSKPARGARTPRVPVHGVLLLNKPLGISSNTAVGWVKRLFSAQKAGHTGTLDPLASGLLPVLLGEATKFSQGLLDADKAYLAEIQLGTTTTTGDREGEVVATRPVSCDLDQVEAAMAQLRGVILQIPPKYSALKVAGRPMYAYARAGLEVPREARAVTIHAFTHQAFADGVLHAFVRCSKGTYIRTLAEDLGEILGCGAHLRALQRCEVGDLRLDQAVELPALEAMAAPDRAACLLPVDALLQHAPSWTLTPDLAQRFMQGQRLPLSGLAQHLQYRVYDEAQQFLGLAACHDDGVLRPVRLVGHES